MQGQIPQDLDLSRPHTEVRVTDNVGAAPVTPKGEGWQLMSEYSSKKFSMWARLAQFAPASCN